MVANYAVMDRVEAPAVTPRPYGLYSVAPPEPMSGRWGVSWQSSACALPDVIGDSCLSDPAAPAPLPQGPKTPTDCPGWTQFQPLTVYANVKTTPGDPVTAADVIANGEQYAVEKALWATLLASAQSSFPAASAQALDQLAAAEDSLAVAYAGRGIIHMCPSAAIRCATALVRVGSQLQTVAGSLVAVGAGYTDGSGAIIATGVVRVWRGPVDTFDSVDTKVNDVYTLAERTVLVGWDCQAIRPSVGG